MNVCVKHVDMLTAEVPFHQRHQRARQRQMDGSEKAEQNRNIKDLNKSVIQV